MSGAETVTRSLSGRWFGHYGMALCPAHEDRKPSLSLKDGDNGQLLFKCHAGCSFEEIRDALSRKGVGSLSEPTWPKADQRTKREAADQRRSRIARKIWDGARTPVGTVAEQYLTLRGITGVLPSTLRYECSCVHPTGTRHPAIVSKVDGSDGFAIHRTYLSTDPLGKADATPNKAMLGSIKGGAVHLSFGGEYLLVAEGLETALSLKCGLVSGRPSIWAALSASGMAALSLPLTSGRLVIAPDGDTVGRKAAYRLADRAYSFGWDVGLLSAPEGYDWNDVLLGKVVPK